ncbi:methyltransferase domain-containing protein [Lyngbya aestuarii]|uniref:methyltransferase domain-containing protein n=1 Tax=Lyngbya aestuarii TaxID=118322 RepID=UPI00403D993D
MNDKIELGNFKQQVADLYSQRSDSYDQGYFHPLLAHCLVEYAAIEPGQKVLDIATGTGLVAIEVAQLVGVDGQVVGVDISKGLLNQAKKKIKEASLNNIKLVLADAETLDFPDESFETILCCSALPLMTNVPADLCLWRRFLKQQGLIGLCVFAETAFVAGAVLQQVAKRYGVSLLFSDLTGTEEKCHALLQEAGFEDIEVKTEQLGSYISLSQAKKTWDGSLNHPLCRPLKQLSPEQLEQVKVEYFAELEALVTDQGIWNDITTFFILGRKAKK